MRASFATVYGESFADIEAEYLAGSRRCWYQLDTCDPLAAEPVGERWSVALAVDCLAPGVHGSSTDGATLRTQRSIELASAGRYRVRTSRPRHSDPEGRPRLSKLLLVRCGDCDEQRIHDFREYEAELEREFAAGLYTFTFLSQDASVVTIDLERVDEAP